MGFWIRTLDWRSSARIKRHRLLIHNNGLRRGFLQVHYSPIASLCREKGKKGKEMRGKSAPCQQSKIGGQNETSKDKKEAAGL